MTETCCCGHVADEHEPEGAGPCEIDGCGCVYFDWDGEDPDD